MNLNLINETIKSYSKDFNDLTIINKEEIYEFITNLKRIMFPNIYKPKIYIERLYIELNEIFDSIGITDNTIDEFFNELVNLKKLLLSDIDAFFDNDPACTCKEEVILSYNSFDAIFIYRISNLLYILNVPYIPRILTEYAHSKTGIDIHPGCTIGSSFFIDHGTGIIIGETTKIGNNVSIYQGVTLGAKNLSDAKSLRGVKRHPTIEDNVIIYANAVILGGDTVIKSGTVVNCNAFIVK
jgi:serine O-acetyltransferase